MAVSSFRVHDLLTKIAERFPNKPALIFQNTSLSFQQLRTDSFKFANGLSQMGIGKGDKIAFFLPNCPQFAVSYLSCFCLGSVGVPLDYMLKTEELISCLEHSDSKVLILKTRKDIDVDLLKKRLPKLELIVSLDDISDQNHSFQTVLNSASASLEVVEIDDADPALIMYTSGTTGRPKGIQLIYKHLQGAPQAMEHFVDLTDKDIKLAAIPLSHIGGFVYLQNCVYFGITVVLMDRFNPFEFLENIHKYKITCFHIVPPMYNAILTLKQIENFDLSSLRWVVVFGAPSSPEIMKRFQKYCPNARLLNGWGMTETCPPNTVTPLDSDNIISVGKAAPHCEIAIVDDNGNPLSVGDIGEVIIRGWVVMDGYYKDPEETNRVLNDGWLYTGDLGRYDSEGYLYIMGRKKEMIKVGGQIVYEPEVEATLYKNEAVVETAVIGVPDAMKGEKVKAFVVLHKDSEVSIDDLRSFARKHLANFKVPQFFEIVDSLPKNRTGKIDKSILRQAVSEVGV